MSEEKEYQRMLRIDLLCGAIRFYITRYQAVPHFPANKETLNRYQKGYEDNLKDLKDLLNG